jgi:hypothetical protein
VAEPELRQIEVVDIGLDRAYRVVGGYVVIDAGRQQQGFLAA